MRVLEVRPVSNHAPGRATPFTVIPAPVSGYGAGSERESRRGGVWTPAFAGVTVNVQRNLPNVLTGGPV